MPGGARIAGCESYIANTVAESRRPSPSTAGNQCNRSQAKVVTGRKAVVRVGLVRVKIGHSQAVLQGWSRVQTGALPILERGGGSLPRSRFDAEPVPRATLCYLNSTQRASAKRLPLSLPPVSIPIR